jgi:hypothetical protein
VAALELVRFETYAEGTSVQILHVGSYDTKGPRSSVCMASSCPRTASCLAGRHHEIYLSDARKVEPARLKTILRQPVAAGARNPCERQP